ncbi:MAG: SBBP repeat-containing protein [Acidobacteria bacterium]|nr:SBBP repeat-containing protein [Acidobacteriota bacterium]
MRFLARLSGYRLLLTSTEAVLTLAQAAEHSRSEQSGRATVRMRLLAANTNPEVEGLDRLSGTSNYFRGRDPKLWQTNIPNYARVRFRDVYPGVDLVYHGAGRQLEYDFVLAPGADPGVIRLAFDGASKIGVDEQGDLALSTAHGDVVLRRPVVWQETKGVKREIAGRYAVKSWNEVGFEVSDYDASAPLVIDPVLVYSTYLGGSGNDEGLGIAVDAAGNAYVVGVTSSTNFPTMPGVVQPAFRGGGSLVTGFPNGDAFVTKLNPTGTALVYSTYLGGSDDDIGSAIAVDAAGNAYITGETESTDFPTTGGALQTTGAANAFVTKLNPTGTALVYSTYLGGDAIDQGRAIAVDTAGNAYVTGSTSVGFSTTPGAFQTTFGGPRDGAFVAKLNPTGTALVYSTYLGGSGDLGEFGSGIAVDAAGNAYVTGSTYSANFPTTPGAYQTVFRGSPFVNTNAFITKVNAGGSALVYSTYLGGSGGERGGDRASRIAVDAAGNAYVTGRTGSRDFPTTPGALRTTGFSSPGFVDAFVTKLNATGTGLVYSTYLGGLSAFGFVVYGSGIAVGSDGSAYVTGTSPVADDYSFVFVGKLNASGAAFVSSTYGGSRSKAATDIAVDPAGNAYVTGSTNSPDFPTTPGAFRTTYGGGPVLPGFSTSVGDAFLLKVDFSKAAVAPSFSPAGTVNAATFLQGPVAPGEIVTIFGTGFGPPTLATLQLTPDGKVNTGAGGTRVLFGDFAAPIIYSVANQLSVIVPYFLARFASTQVQIEYLGTRSAPVTLPVAPSSPGIFTLNASGKGPGAILNQDYSVNSAGNPASVGSILQIFATGEGQTKPPGVDGSLAAIPLPAPLLPVSVKIGGIPAEVQYAGAAPGLVAGVLQVNAKVPPGVTPGSAVPVSLTVGTATSPDGVTVAIK